VRTISGKVVDGVVFASWSPIRRSRCTAEFLNKLDKRRAKNKVAKASRKANR
jgi:hypothetical protein